MAAGDRSVPARAEQRRVGVYAVRHPRIAADQPRRKQEEQAGFVLLKFHGVALGGKLPAHKSGRVWAKLKYYVTILLFLIQATLIKADDTWPNISGTELAEPFVMAAFNDAVPTVIKRPGDKIHFRCPTKEQGIFQVNL